MIRCACDSMDDVIARSSSDLSLPVAFSYVNFWLLVYCQNY